MKVLKIIKTSIILLISLSSFSQIVFTNIPDTTIYAGDTIAFDINSDEINDFSLHVYSSDGSSHFGKIEAFNNNLVASHEGYFGYWITNFDENEEIYEELFLAETTGGQLCLGPYSYGFNGCFCNTIDRFIGLKLIAGNTYYGWLQVDVGPNGSWITIKGWAYNSNPYQPITTPTITDINFNSLSEIEIFPIPTTEKLFINLKSTKEILKISIVNIDGQIISVSEINSGEEVDVSNLKEGIYFIKIKTGNLIITEKFLKI